TGRWPDRSNSWMPSWVSRLAMLALTPDCTRRNLPAPARKLPQSATATKVRIWSRVRASSMICFSDQNYRNYVTSAVRPGSLACACFALKRSSMSTLTQDAPLRAPAGATQWATVAMVVASGVVAAVQVGKAAIAVPMLQADLGLNLGAIGWLTGIFAILSVVGGIPAGAVVSSAGDKRVLAAGLLGIAAGAALGAATSSYAVLLGSRVLEGAGFLFVTVAAPAILGRPDVVAARHRDQAFALWSCFMPAGM